MSIYGPEAFTGYANGDDPTDWLDTQVSNSMTAGDLFEVFTIDSDKCFGTTNGGSNFHTHYHGSGYASLSNYRVTGKLRINNTSCGCGITVLSNYDSSDEYYRIRRYAASTDFHVNNHGGVGISGGTSTSSFDPGDGTNVGSWINFKVEAEDTGSRTEIRARFWKVGDSEPGTWQIDFYDSTGGRNTAGTFGFWGYNDANGSYYDDIEVVSLTEANVSPGDAVATSSASIGGAIKGSISASPGNAIATSSASIDGVTSTTSASPGNAIATSAASIDSINFLANVSPGNAIATSLASIVGIFQQTNTPTEVSLTTRVFGLELFERYDTALSLPTRDIALTVSR